jgi:hypothetical protein
MVRQGCHGSTVRRAHGKQLTMTLGLTITAYIKFDFLRVRHISSMSHSGRKMPLLWEAL